MEPIPLISIIIPTYNQHDVVGQTIESAIAQDYPNIEIIIADDNSTDKTGVIAKQLAKNDLRIKYFCNDRNLGRIGNYRKALYEYANGDYALNLDGDDILIDNSFISTSVKRISALDNNLPVLVVACKRLATKKAMITILHDIEESFKLVSGLDFILEIFSKYQFSHLTTLFNRKIALKNDFYSLQIQSTDIDSILRMAFEGSVIVTNDLVGQWNETNKNISQIINLNKSLENLIWIDSISAILSKKVNFFKVFLWRKKCQIKFSLPLILAIYKDPMQTLKIKHRKSFLGMIIPMIIYIITYLFKKIFNIKNKCIQVKQLL